MTVLEKLWEIFPDHRSSSNGWYNINCPFCEEEGYVRDTRYLLGINYKKKYVHCHKCRRVHKLDYFLKLVEVDFGELDLTSSEETYTPVSKVKELNFPNEFINIIGLLDSKNPNYIQALKYIDTRIGIELAIELSVGFCDIGDYANRIVIPIFNREDEIIYFVARAIYDFIVPKVKNPPGERKSIMFNWNTAQKFSEMYLMEGIFGAVTMYPYGVATLGKEVTEEQIFLILRSEVKIVNILLDFNAMEDAYLLAKKIRDLTSLVKIRVLKLRCCQPDNFDFNHILNIRKNTPFYRESF